MVCFWSKSIQKKANQFQLIWSPNPPRNWNQHLCLCVARASCFGKKKRDVYSWQLTHSHTHCFLLNPKLSCWVHLYSNPQTVAVPPVELTLIWTDFQSILSDQTCKFYCAVGEMGNNLVILFCFFGMWYCHHHPVRKPHFPFSQKKLLSVSHLTVFFLWAGKIGTEVVGDQYGWFQPGPDLSFALVRGPNQGSGEMILGPCECGLEDSTKDVNLWRILFAQVMFTLGHLTSIPDAES